MRTLINIVLVCVSSNFSSVFAKDIDTTKVPIQDVYRLTSQERTKELRKMKDIPLKPLWDLTGHLDTPYAIALFAGRGEKEAQLISYYSEYPDEFKEFSATGQFITHNFKWRKLIYTKLHTLHGGKHKAVNKRRNAIRNAIKESLNNPNEIWKTGILIHALGDSYAHTKGKYNSPDERAFNKYTGHGIESIFLTDPDEIFKKENEEKYIAFITDLFNLLKTKNKDQAGFNSFVNDFRSANCNSNECILNKTTLNFVHGKALNSQKTLNATLTPLTKAQVVEALNMIKD